ncbi:protein disulfide-isomerase A5 [Condylostylus longicornis]|uniref:protein disulfide-isomerase A5 n=1 Tax=Condylostylus longicornis TaxID=2530218 RepID=UPI00244DDD6E|nr:protein disulfide-isomerase A5 [Condylostylus longicornis]
MQEFKNILTICLIFMISIQSVLTKLSQNVVIDNVNDIKELKKIFRTKTNVLVMFVENTKDVNIKVFKEAAEIVKGVGTMVLIDCSNNEKKKICKKLKVQPSPHILKHYKDGDFHKDYDRQMQVSSMVNFMRDPSGDLPWEEDPKGADVLHIADINQLNKILKKEHKPMLIMFYAPWCGFCKKLKPDYGEAASELKGKYVIAAMDVDRPENTPARRLYNITGFPTLLYFENGKMKYSYEGENNKAGLISFMENPTAPPIAKPKEDDWSVDPTSEIVHLTTTGFEPALKDEKSVLVMFHAPWCGHCKRMKPEYEKAAVQMRNEKIPGILAALDATKETAIAQKYGVKGYPTVKYFVNGEFKFDVNIRDAEKIVNFMKDPKEPPPPPPPEKSWDEEESEVEHLNEETFKPFLKKKKHALVIFYAPWCGHCKRAKPEFTAAAETFKEDPRVAFAAVDCTKHSAICSAYEVRGYPSIKYFSYLKTKIDYTGGRTEKDFVKFVKNPTDESAQIKDPEPFGDFPGAENILFLNDENFDREASKIKRLLVMFYAPWCGHCKSMKPDYAKAAIDAIGDTRLGAVDCDVNKKLVEQHKIKGFPTIILFEKGKYISTYDGPRKANDLLSYVKGTKLKKDEL